MIGVRKGLHHAVIGNGDRRMPPLIGALYQILRLGNAVHIAHLRMTVKLYSLLRRSVLP